MAKKKEVVEVVEVVEKDAAKETVAFITRSYDLENRVKEIRQNLSDSVENFARIGEQLLEIQSGKLYELSECANLFEFTRKVFGFSETVTRNYISLANLGISKIRELDDQGYNVSQVIELLPVVDDLSKFKPEMSVKEIRTQKSVLKMDEFEKNMLFELQNSSSDLISRFRNPIFSIVTTYKPKKGYEEDQMIVSVKNVCDVIKIKRLEKRYLPNLYQLEGCVSGYYSSAFYSSMADLLNAIDYKKLIDIVSKILKEKKMTAEEKKKEKDFEKLADESDSPLVRLHDKEIDDYLLEKSNYKLIGVFEQMKLEVYQLKDVPCIAKAIIGESSIFIVDGQFNYYGSWNAKAKIAGIRIKFIDELKGVKLEETVDENNHEGVEEDEEEIIE